MKWLCWFLLALGAHAAEPSALPAGVWSVSETSGATIRGSWAFLPATSSFEAHWLNGTSARLRLEAWDGTRLRITRLDTLGPTAGLRTVYEGQRSGSWVEGTVTWYWPGGSRRGLWTARLPEDPLAQPGR